MRVFLGITGASGAIYGGRALNALTAAGCDVGLCISDSGAHVISHEILEAGPRPPDDPALVVATFIDRFAADAGQRDAARAQRPDGAVRVGLVAGPGGADRTLLRGLARGPSPTGRRATSSTAAPT